MNSFFISRFGRSICTKIYQAELSPDAKRIADGLISIFTNKPLGLENQELSHLGSKLTTEIAETVLAGIKNWRIAYKFFTWATSQSGYHHTCYTYNAMASILSRARRNAPLKELAFDVVNSRCSMTPGALGFLIRCLGSVKLVEEASALFDQVKMMGLCVPNNYTYSCLLETISKSDLINLAEMRMNEMVSNGWEADKFVLTPMLKVYCNAGKFDKAWAVFDQIHTRGWVDAHVLCILVLSLSKWGEVDKAFELIERMENYNVSLNEKTFYVLIHGFVSASRVDKALQLFEKMCKVGVLPDTGIYDVLIGGLCKTKEPEKALYLYSQMKSAGIVPDIGILTKLISCVPDEDEIIKLFEESGIILDGESTILLYNSILSALVNNGSIEKAYRVFRSMIGDKLDCETGIEKLFKVNGIIRPNPTSFNIIIDGLCKSGRLDEALDLFKDMDQIALRKDITLYNNLIDAMNNSDRFEDSLYLLGEMKNSGFQPTQFTYNSVYGYFCRREDVPEALNVVKEMRLHGHEPWIKHSTSLVKQLCKHGRAVEACKFLIDMVEEGFFLDIIPYSAAIDGLLKIKEVDRALELFQTICARGYRPDVIAYNILINGLCKAKRVSESQDVLNEMLSNGLVPSVVTYNSLIDGWCKDGDIDKALLCFSKMCGEEREPNVVTYTTLIDGLCNDGRPDDAATLWVEMERKGCTPNSIAFMAMINGLCKNGRPDAALVYLRDMDKKGLRADSFVYIALMGAFLSNTNPHAAFGILKEMVDKEMFPERVDRNHSLLKDAIFKLSEDPCTSSNVKRLLAAGSIQSNFPVVVVDEAFKPTT
ncbi:hypothetical protein Nepgr_009457 [Nepenthes gracilis]|uniref:PROP1-like PPR domain-containing protein n=1 Tax=Nepenthes gracilis TaxID=150966 RepID=A0AAD3XK61_NEPGR|nr:hypothetical protein Nepgr_009457 [Nepenthes gracilis]